ncbi:hypothetical protein KI688_010313 [Linnemannia hyalina]|uniref:Uncharacterized protein n=1 Tax=Linnemannia hyalina TaxID=64524 RepID=A0A9P7XYB4_9FUNG|nr:hypothetical protein KI688_010313 [Linnemannia hyalina]
MEMDQFNPNNTKELETVFPEPLISLPKSEAARRPTVYRGHSNVTYVLRLMYAFAESCFRMPRCSVFSSSEFLSLQKDGIAAVMVQRVEVPRNIPDNMLRALEASSQSQANAMQVLTKRLSAAHDNIAQQSSQSVWANNMLSIYEEFRRYESELEATLGPTDGESKSRVKLPQRQADDTERHISNIRIIANEVDLIQERLMHDDALSKDEALLTVFKGSDGLVKLRSRDGNYSCSLATELCTEQMKDREELKTRK